LREAGIPALVNVAHAYTSLTDSTLVQVDPIRGSLQIVPPRDPPDPQRQAV
jgi:phosphoenolpyruvate-protein kinase (PTS system EI component)